MAEAAKKWMWAVLAMTLVLGAGLGVLLDRLVLESTVYSRSANLQRGHADGEHSEHLRRFMERLEEELRLSPEQRSQVESAVTTNHEMARVFWRDSRRRFRELRQKFREDLRAALTDEQRAGFDRMLSEHDRDRDRQDRD